MTDSCISESPDSRAWVSVSGAEDARIIFPTEKWGESLLFFSSQGSLSFANKKAETEGHGFDRGLGHSPVGDLQAQVSPLHSEQGRNESSQGNYTEMCCQVSPRKHDPTVPKSAPKAQALPGPIMVKPGRKVLGEGLLSCASHQGVSHQGLSFTWMKETVDGQLFSQVSRCESPQHIKRHISTPTDALSPGQGQPMC